MKKTALFFALSAIAPFSLLLLSLPAQGAAAQAFNRPNFKISNGASANWSGYAAATSLSSPQKNSVSDVKGEWTVPAVTGAGTNSYSCVWVGIDGYTDGTVEQIGTEQDWTNGSPRYYAWFEMYPKTAITVKSMAINPGDSISAEVSFMSKNGFRLTLTDLTTGRSYSTTQKSRRQRSSAEWIVEAPSGGTGVLPLADFSSVTFTAAAATVNGHSGSINDAAWQNDPITMTANGTIKAQPTSLSPDGSSFGVNWMSS